MYFMHVKFPEYKSEFSIYRPLHLGISALLFVHNEIRTLLYSLKTFQN